MGWVIPLTFSTYDIGPNLLLELPFGITSTKPDPADCRNTLFTFTKPIYVKDGLLYLCSACSLCSRHYTRLQTFPHCQKCF